jgi:hypothetical protein
VSVQMTQYTILPKGIGSHSHNSVTEGREKKGIRKKFTILSTCTMMIELLISTKMFVYVWCGVLMCVRENLSIPNQRLRPLDPPGTGRKSWEKIRKIFGGNTASTFQRFPVLSCRNRPVIFDLGLHTKKK